MTLYCTKLTHTVTVLAYFSASEHIKVLIIEMTNFCLLIYCIFHKHSLLSHHQIAYYRIILKALTELQLLSLAFQCKPDLNIQYFHI